MMCRTWEWKTGESAAVCFLRRRCEARGKKRAPAAVYFEKRLFSSVQVWYLGRTTRLPPTSDLIAGVNVDYVWRLCICADLYVCAGALLPRIHVHRASNKLFARSSLLPSSSSASWCASSRLIQFFSLRTIIRMTRKNADHRVRVICELSSYQFTRIIRANDTWIIIVL